MQQYDILLLRFGELTMKGKNRYRFEKAALTHVKSLLNSYPNAQVVSEYGRIYVMLHGEPASEIIELMKKVFGLHSICPVIVTPSELEDILAGASSFMESLSIKEGTTFKVNARRVWKDFPHSTQEMNRLVSTPLLQSIPALRVDVHQPEIELRVEIRQTGTYLYHEIIPGAGGFPRATNGKAMLLLSGGIDSPVAGWSAMRRGLELECVHFHSYPFTSKRAEEKVIDLARVMSGYAGEMKLHLVPFTAIQTLFTQVGQDKLMITLMRRAMLRIATKLAEREKALALVTGESLGQVASQTLPSMNVIERATDLPVIRPLVTMDKDDIIALSQQIGTYEISILPFEDCCTLFVPKSPATNPNLRVVERVEVLLSDLESLIEQAVEQTETVYLQPGEPDVRSGATIEVVEEKWF